MHTYIHTLTLCNSFVLVPVEGSRPASILAFPGPLKWFMRLPIRILYTSPALYEVVESNILDSNLRAESCKEK